MLELVREELLYFFQQVMMPDVRFMTLEPSLTSGEAQSDIIIKSLTLLLSLFCYDWV